MSDKYDVMANQIVPDWPDGLEFGEYRKMIESSVATALREQAQPTQSSPDALKETTMTQSDSTASGSVTREPDGQISLTFRTTTGVVKYTAPINIWASHFCDASRGGEEHFRYFTAMSFLKSSGPVDVVPVPVERSGILPHGTGEWPHQHR